eukprot:scaffold1531_cov59-Phaeocystis_antarctica.AAC.6
MPAVCSCGRHVLYPVALIALYVLPAEQTRRNRQLRRRLARASEAGLHRQWLGLAAGVRSCPEPPGAP